MFELKARFRVCGGGGASVLPKFLSSGALGECLNSRNIINCTCTCTCTCRSGPLWSVISQSSARLSKVLTHSFDSETRGKLSEKPRLEPCYIQYVLCTVYTMHVPTLHDIVRAPRFTSVFAENATAFKRGMRFQNRVWQVGPHPTLSSVLKQRLIPENDLVILQSSVFRGSIWKTLWLLGHIPNAMRLPLCAILQVYPEFAFSVLLKLTSCSRFVTCAAMSTMTRLKMKACMPWNVQCCWHRYGVTCTFVPSPLALPPFSWHQFWHLVRLSQHKYCLSCVLI